MRFRLWRQIFNCLQAVVLTMISVTVVIMAFIMAIMCTSFIANMHISCKAFEIVTMFSMQR